MSTIGTIKDKIEKATGFAFGVHPSSPIHEWSAAPRLCVHWGKGYVLSVGTRNRFVYVGRVR